VDWRALLHNRLVLFGVAGAAAVGGLVWWKRRGASGSAAGASSGSGMSQTPAGYAGGPGSFDSTGTDVASWLGSYSGNLQTQLDQYQGQLTDALANLQQVPTTGGAATSPGPATPPPKPTQLPPVKPKAPKYVSATRYTTSATPWSSTLSGIARHYNTSVGALLKLNPTIKNANVIYAGQKIRVG